MQQFWVFVRKEFYHIFRDKKSLLIIFALPIAQMLIFGFALTNEIKNTQIGILDNANDEASLNLIAQLEASKYFEISNTFTNPDEIDAAFKAMGMQ